MTYKWTISEVDEVEMPMIHVLLEEMKQLPPQDFLANAQVRAMGEKMKREQQAAIGSLGVVKGKVRRRKNGE